MAATAEERDQLAKANEGLSRTAAADLGKVKEELALQAKIVEELRVKYEKAKRMLKSYMDRYSDCREKHISAR